MVRIRVDGNRARGSYRETRIGLWTGGTMASNSRWLGARRFGNGLDVFDRVEVWKRVLLATADGRRWWAWARMLWMAWRGRSQCVDVGVGVGVGEDAGVGADAGFGADAGVGADAGGGAGTGGTQARAARVVDRTRGSVSGRGWSVYKAARVARRSGRCTTRDRMVGRCRQDSGGAMVERRVGCLDQLSHAGQRVQRTVTRFG